MMNFERLPESKIAAGNISSNYTNGVSCLPQSLAIIWKFKSLTFKCTVEKTEANSRQIPIFIVLK